MLTSIRQENAMPHDTPSASAGPLATPISQARTLEDASALLRQILDELASRAVVHISTNSRGRAQFDLRLPYATIAEATTQVTLDIPTLISAIRAALTASGLALAGDGEDVSGPAHARQPAQTSKPVKEATTRE
jgi:hypothetical protein